MLNYSYRTIIYINLLLNIFCKIVLFIYLFFVKGKSKALRVYKTKFYRCAVVVMCLTRRLRSERWQ